MDFSAWAGLKQYEMFGDWSGCPAFKTVFDTMLPDATQIADPFHLVRLATQRHRARRLLTKAD